VLDKSHAHGSGILQRRWNGKEAHLRRQIAHLIDDSQRAGEMRTDRDAALRKSGCIPEL
jgi:hypothetical protein